MYKITVAADPPDTNPPQKLASKMKWKLCPKKINNQNVIDGTVKASVDRLQPTDDIIYPTTMDPIRLPMLLREPIHELCSLVNGPDRRGVFSDVNFGKAGAT